MRSQVVHLHTLSVGRQTLMDDRIDRPIAAAGAMKQHELRSTKLAMNHRT